MPRLKKTAKDPKISLDVPFAKRERGRPGVLQSEIVGRAENYRSMFWGSRLDKKKKMYVRDKPYEWAIALLAAKNNTEIDRTLDSAPNYPQSQLKPLVPLILKVLREQDFPKRMKTKFDFLANSLAARGEVTPRRSRDICQEERLKAKRAHYIIRYEFKIECACGFKGFSKDHGCPRCGAKIPFGMGSIYCGGLF